MPINSCFSFLHRVVVWCRRWRHRQGYGVHSPFAFNLISDVMYNTWDYYAYAPLAEQRDALAGRLCEKDDRLIFRLANHWQSRSVAFLGRDWQRTAAYVQAACPKAQCAFWGEENSGEGDEILPASSLPLPTELLRRCDTLLIDPTAAGEWATATAFPLDPPPHPALLIVTDIHSDAAARQLWRQLQADKAVSVTFDLYRLGLAYLDPQLNKQDYVVNFF